VVPVRISTVVIGAGHAGLAMSHRLTQRSIDHVVLERGAVANSWRTERWDSLRLLTPNWQTGLPGRPYDGDDPDGFMTADAVADTVTEYAAAITAPVHTSSPVITVRALHDEYEVVTPHSTWRAATVVVASGPANIARLPPFLHGLPSDITVHTALTYRRASELPEGGVLVIGASASGAQIAAEIQRSGRPVVIGVGEHVRLPRTYRGRDIFWWLDRTDVLDERHDQIDDLVRARNVPSPQLAGSTDPARAVDLDTLQRLGVTVVGRVGRITQGRVQCSGGLANTCALADLKMNRLLDRCDTAARERDLDVDPPGSSHRPEPVHVATGTLEVDLRRSGIRSVVLATGMRPDHSWLDLPVLDTRGRIVHHGGVITGAPGTYVLGQNILRRRRSSYISGAAADTAELAETLHRQLDATRHRHVVRR
jgi:putative flavoprotein involved in K+ transport